MVRRQGLHINVGDLLGAGADTNKSISIDFEPPPIDPEIKLTRPVTGLARFIAATNGVVGFFKLKTDLELACSVDSEPYRHSLHLEFQHEFSSDTQDQYTSPIARDHSIDLLPVIWDEIVVSIPMKPLCPKHQE